MVTFEHDYRIYRDTIAAAVQFFRPCAEVESASLEALGEHIERFEPDLVICSGHEEARQSGGRPAWVELSLDPLQPSKIWVGGRYSEPTNPTLEVLLEVIDEVEELLQTNNQLGGC